MKKYYRIAFQNICIDAPHFPQDSSYWKSFEIFPENNTCENTDSDITFTCKIVDELPVPEDITPVSKNNVDVYADGGRIFRNKHMGTASGVLTCYSQKNISESTSYFTSQSFNTMMDSRYMWDSISFAQLMLMRNTVLMHSSFIEFNGKALLFSAPSGTGKSTQADLWQRYKNARILNGDKSAVSVTDGKVFAHGVPFCGTSGICHNASIPLCAIVILHQSKVNTVCRLTGIKALQKITENIYLDFLAPDEQRKCVDLIIDILSTVPVYSLGCTPDEEAVTALENELRKEGLI